MEKKVSPIRNIISRSYNINDTFLLALFLLLTFSAVASQHRYRADTGPPIGGACYGGISAATGIAATSAVPGRVMRILVSTPDGSHQVAIKGGDGLLVQNQLFVEVSLLHIFLL